MLYHGVCCTGVSPSKTRGLVHRDLDKEELLASAEMIRAQPHSGVGLTACPSPQPLPSPPDLPAGLWGGAPVCFLLFAEGSHSLSSALFIIGLGTAPASALCCP